MSKQIESLSVFLPTYNEEGNIKSVVSSVKKVLTEVASKWEIIVVNDGSKDGTASIVKDLEKRDKRIRLINHPSNKGYGGALKTGFEKARYPWVAFMDSDGQFDFGEINDFIKEKDNADLILGYRKKRADPFIRNVFTFGWATIARILLGLRARDYSCGFKMIKKSVFNSIQPLVGEEKVTQIEMLVKARKQGFKFADVGVNHYPRKVGTQTGANIKVVAKSIGDLFMLWGKMNKIGKKELLILLGIVVIGSFLRFYKISDYMTFLGDEGRDVIIVRRIFSEGHPPLIGPGSSVGNVFLGPLYYYMMALPLLFANFSPVGPALMIGLLGILTIIFIWYVGRKWFGETGALISAFLYSISPTVITFSQSSWNPNIMPFFALLAIYSIWKIWKEKDSKWFIWLGISFAFVLQSHYLGIFLLPVAAIFIFTKKVKIKDLVFAGVVFLVLMSPLILFDLRHNFVNYHAFRNLLGHTSGTFGGIKMAISNFVPLFIKVVTHLLSGKNQLIGIGMSLFLALGSTYLISKRKINPILIAWFVIGVFGLSFYRNEVYDHYFGFLFPAPFLISGAIFANLFSNRNRIIKTALIIFLVVLVFTNLINSRLFTPPNRQLQRTIEISKVIKENAKGMPFNLVALIPGTNVDPYEYFLLLWGEKLETDTITNQLFVICYNFEVVCDPINDPAFAIKKFNPIKIDGHWQSSGNDIYRLTH